MPQPLILCVLMNLIISAPYINLSISMLFPFLHILSILTGRNVFLRICLSKMRRLFLSFAVKVSLAFTGIQSPDGPAHSDLLYRLSYLYEEKCVYIYNLKYGLLWVWFVLTVSVINFASIFTLVANITILIY